MQWTAQTLQLCLVQIELKCFKSGTKLKLFLTFLSINYQKAGGGFSPIRVNNRIVLSVPLPKPEDEFDLLIGAASPNSQGTLNVTLEQTFIPTVPTGHDLPCYTINKCRTRKGILH
ncbi:hypothetical protein Peur_054112 [Populus x canadensis]